MDGIVLPGASAKMPLVSAQRNNNAYRRDNEIIWFDWELRRTYADIHRIVRMMVAFRARRDVVIERSRLTLNELLKQARIE